MDSAIHKIKVVYQKGSSWANLQEPVSKTIWKETSEEAAGKKEKKQRAKEKWKLWQNSTIP